VSEKIGYAATSGGRQTGRKSDPWEPRGLAGACSGGKFVVLRSGKAYDAHARGPNRKFRVSCMLSVGRDLKTEMLV
jgi:hypothetical protein